MTLVNGLFVVQGEANAVLALLRTFLRSQTRQHLRFLDEHNPLLRNFADLRDVLNKVHDLNEVQFDTFLSPFLEVIRSEAMDGPITSQSLAAVEKFINYGLLTANNIRIGGAVQSIADAVITKTKFLLKPSKAGIDECLLFQILQALRSLLLSPGGLHLSNNTVYEVLLCCFDVGLKSSLPVLFVAAESALADMCRHLFAAMQTFGQDIRMGLKKLMKYLVALCNSHDDQKKKDDSKQRIQMGLHLLTVSFETGNEFLRENDSLLLLLKDDLAHTLLQLLDTQNLEIFTATNRVCFLLFDVLRPHMKFQMESYFLKLEQLISHDQQQIDPNASAAKVAASYELRELALEALVDMWRLPGLVAELYLNYDCSLYCSNLFEDLVRNLLQNAFPTGPLLSTHILSLDAVLTVVDMIERDCAHRQQQHKTTFLDDNIIDDALQGQSHEETEQKNQPCIESPPAHNPSMLNHASDSCHSHIHNNFDEEKHSDHDDIKRQEEHEKPDSHQHYHQQKQQQLLVNPECIDQQHPPPPPSLAEMIDVKKQKRLMTEGTELFNRHAPQKGVEFLCEKGLLKNPLEPKDVANWLRQNPRLDKSKIAEYICNRKRPEVLRAFVESFEFDGLRLDCALRLFVETFRLPGDAAEIDKIINHFSEHWFNANGKPFEHVDAAYTLAYAILMLNTDQHNPQVRRNQQLMSVEDFKRNLSGTNHGKDFDPEMLEQIYMAIKKEEIVMPAEQVGQVRENYLWRVLQRRSETPEGNYWPVPYHGWNDRDLFCVIWGPLTAALHYVINKTEDDTILAKCLSGYRKCASIAAYFGMTDVFDTLIIHLCKITMAPA